VGSSSDPLPEVRRSPRKRAHALFETSPTKEGTTQDEMMGERASTGIWARDSPFSVELANRKSAAALEGETGLLAESSQLASSISLLEKVKMRVRTNAIGTGRLTAGSVW
jgi:hypothetical protein